MNMEPKSEGLEAGFPFTNWVIFRFQPLIFQGVQRGWNLCHSQRYAWLTFEATYPANSQLSTFLSLLFLLLADFECHIQNSGVPSTPFPLSYIPIPPPKKKKKRTTSNNSTTNNISIQHHNIQQPTWAPTQNKNAPNTKRFPSKKTKHHRASIGRKLDQPYGFKPEIGTTLTLGVDGAWRM